MGLWGQLLPGKKCTGKKTLQKINFVDIFVVFDNFTYK
jgi:hypothetical protein